MINNLQRHKTSSHDIQNPEIHLEFVCKFSNFLLLLKRTVVGYFYINNKSFLF